MAPGGGGRVGYDEQAGQAASVDGRFCAHARHCVLRVRLLPGPQQRYAALHHAYRGFDGFCRHAYPRLLDCCGHRALVRWSHHRSYRTQAHHGRWRAFAHRGLGACHSAARLLSANRAARAAGHRLCLRDDGERDGSCRRSALRAIGRGHRLLRARTIAWHGIWPGLRHIPLLARLYREPVRWRCWRGCGASHPCHVLQLREARRAPARDLGIPCARGETPRACSRSRRRRR